MTLAWIADILNGAINMFLAGMVQNADQNLIKGVLSLRCFLTSGFDETWKVLLATYYTMKAFGLQNYLKQGMDQIMPTICSCKIEVQGWSRMFGSGAETAAANLSYCSETAQTEAEAQESESTSSSSSSSGSTSSGGNTTSSTPVVQAPLFDASIIVKAAEGLTHNVVDTATALI